MSRSNYDKFPKISVPNSEGKCVAGWKSCAERLRVAVAKRSTKRTVIVIECYSGVNETEIVGELKTLLKPVRVIRSAEAMLESAAIESLVAPFLGGNDPVFGFLSGLTLPQFFDP